MDEDWHAICQVTFTRASGERHGRTCATSSWEMNKEVKVGHPSGSCRAKTLWKMGGRGAKERGDMYQANLRDEN